MTSPRDAHAVAVALPPLDVTAFYTAVREGDTRAMAAYFAQPSAVAAARETETRLARDSDTTADSLRLPPTQTPDVWTNSDLRRLRARLSRPFPGRWFDDVRDTTGFSIIRFSPVESVAWLFGADSGLCHMLPRTMALLLSLRLHDAVQRGDCKTLDALLSSATFVTCFSATEQSALLDRLSHKLLSIQHASDDAVNVLLAHGATIDAVTLSTTLSIENKTQSRAMTQRIACLVANGAWVVGCNRIFDGCGSGSHAWYYSDHAFFRAMTWHGADVRGTAWHNVVDGLDEDAVDVLLTDGCVDVDSSCGDDQRTPLMVVACSNAQRWNYVSGLVELLLHYGANVEARDTQGRTALMLAARAHRADDHGPTENEVVAVLLAQGGADATARDHAGRTPLHHVCDALRVHAPSRFLLHTAAQLVAHGADVNARDADGYTPLELITVKSGTERPSHGWLTALLRVLRSSAADASSVVTSPENEATEPARTTTTTT